MTTRGIRINNPGDIRRSSNSWLGKVTPSRDDAFETFDCMENGIRAMALLLYHYWHIDKLVTLDAMARKYAPPSENDTGAYIETLCDRTGYDAHAGVDFPDDLAVVVKAFIDAEQGSHAGEISEAQLQAGVKLALHTLNLTTSGQSGGGV